MFCASSIAGPGEAFVLKESKGEASVLKESKGDASVLKERRGISVHLFVALQLGGAIA